MGNPWTPGPWCACQEDSYGEVPFIPVENVAGDHIVCEVQPDCAIDDSLALTAMCHANARLIAEAPAMAEMLEAWIELWNGFDGTQTTRRADPATLERIRATRAILARIRGDAP